MIDARHYWVTAVILFSRFFKSSFQIPDLATPDLSNFFSFCEKSGTVGRPTVPDLVPPPDFFLCFVQIFYVFPCVVESSDLSTLKQHDPTKVCCDEAAVGAMAASRGR